MIEKSVLLPLALEQAFELFCRRIDDWWPADRRHINHPESAITLDAKRFYEHEPGGREVELGAIRVWEPPRRILLDWYPGTDPSHPTEVEISFHAEGEGTRVQVQHGPGPKSRDLYPLRAPRYATSWDLVLEALARAAQRA